MAVVARRKRGDVGRCVIGIDQSYTGFAAVVIHESGSYVPTHAVFPVKLGGVDRLLAIEQWLGRLLTQYGDRVSHVAMEDYGFSSQKAVMAGELGYAVKRTLRLHPALDVPVCYPTIVGVSHVKQFATGRGNAKKDDMKLAVYKKWGFETSNDNLADAFTIARIAAAIAYRDEPLGYEAVVLGKLRTHTEWPGRV